MRQILAVLAFFLVTTLSAADADLSKPIAVMRLADGHILQNVTFAGFKTETVLLKHAGGFTAVRYEFLPADLRAAAELKRPGGPRYFAGEIAAEKVTVSGQVFIQTVGAGPYKFGNVTVYAFQADCLDLLKAPTGTPQLPKPIAQTVTDADGKFKLTVPKGAQYFLFAQAQRGLLDGSTERFEWHVPASEIKYIDQVNLSGDWRYPYRPVKIEPIE